MAREHCLQRIESQPAVSFDVMRQHEEEQQQAKGQERPEDAAGNTLGYRLAGACRHVAIR